MVELSRKQREMKEREQQILALARQMLIHEGYQSLTMDRLAQKMEYAKGTLYNHFPNKEEIVAALALESLNLRRSLFERASGLSPSSRERMMAIGCACDVYALRCSDHFATEQMLRNATIWEKSSEKRQNLIQNCEFSCMSIVAGIVRDAVAQQDLTLPSDLGPEEFVFGFWALMFGGHTLVASSPSLTALGIHDPTQTMSFHAFTLMNGYGWSPLHTFEEFKLRQDELTDEIVATVHEQQDGVITV